MIEAIYPLALEQNILPDQFWEFSVLEILDILEAARRKEEKKLDEWKAKIELQFFTADAISSRIAYIFGDEKKRSVSNILLPWNVYPDLFENKAAEIEQKQNEAALQKYKTGMAAYAARWNERVNNGQ